MQSVNYRLHHESIWSAKVNVHCLRQVHERSECVYSAIELGSKSLISAFGLGLKCLSSALGLGSKCLHSAHVTGVKVSLHCPPVGIKFLYLAFELGSKWRISTFFFSSASWKNKKKSLLDSFFRRFQPSGITYPITANTDASVTVVSGSTQLLFRSIYRV